MGRGIQVRGRELGLGLTQVGSWCWKGPVALPPALPVPTLTTLASVMLIEHIQATPALGPLHLADTVPGQPHGSSLTPWSFLFMCHLREAFPGLPCSKRIFLKLFLVLSLLS